MINFLKQIFTWWNRQTVGTFIYTFFSGKFVGNDEFGNKYYQNKKGKRWVIYHDQIEATQIPPEWFFWIHFLTNHLPDKNQVKKYSWQKKHTPNLTGTKKSYKPKGSLISENIDSNKKYESWNP